jgi:hypothetical protein
MRFGVEKSLYRLEIAVFSKIFANFLKKFKNNVETGYFVGHIIYIENFHSSLYSKKQRRKNYVPL